MRPIFHHGEDRVGAHIFVAALSFLLERLLDKRLKDAGSALSTADAFRALETIRHVTFRVKGGVHTAATPGNARAREVLKVLGIRDTRPPTPPKGAETQM